MVIEGFTKVRNYPFERVYFSCFLIMLVDVVIIGMVFIDYTFLAHRLRRSGDFDKKEYLFIFGFLFSTSNDERKDSGDIPVRRDGGVERSSSFAWATICS